MSGRSIDRFLSSRGALSSSFSLFRGSLLAALGLAAAACAGEATTEGAAGNTGTAGSGATGAAGGAGGSGGSGAAGGTTGTASSGGSGGEGGTSGPGGQGGSGGAGASGGAGGGTGGSGASGGAGGSGGGTGCEGAIPILQPNGAASGFVMCPDGAINRVAKATCDLDVPLCNGNESFIGCASDADCNAQPNGRCGSYTTVGFGGPMTMCDCLYPCATDNDCAGGVCACRGVVDKVASQCVTTVGCTGPEDCPSGECGLSLYDNGCYTETATLCRSDEDACHADVECPPDLNQCVASPQNPGVWSCAGYSCIIGRPLVAEGSVRFAEACSRADWRDAAIAPDTAALPAGVREALAACFTEMAAFEHASVASFARFTLELLALGAPPDLLLLTQQAMADEIAHARIAYSLASAYGGSPVGPGPLPVAGVVPATDPEEIVRALVTEACVGETVAAAEALALSHITTDPALRAAWTRIAEDEARHAELGWRALSWMLASGSPRKRDAAAEAFASAMASVAEEAAPHAAVTSSQHGLLDAAARGAVRRKAVRDIVEPCARALLAAPRREARPAASA